MVTPTIRTFCEKCALLSRTSYKVKLISHKTTTEKKKYCERCHDTVELGQYLIDRINA